MEFDTVGLIGKYGVADVKPHFDYLISFFNSENVDFIIEQETALRYKFTDYKTLSRNELGHQCDLVIVVGGDGSFLNAARDMACFNQPMLGINLGRLGFLTDIAPDEIKHCLKEVLAGNYRAEKRCLLTSEIIHEGARNKHGLAMNDVVIHKWGGARMIEFETKINGRFVNDQRSDGLIISTPTGSTAYALSGGGPIIEPSVDALAVVSICPHTLSYRPLVIPGDSKVEILVIDSPQPKAQVTCDGQMNFGLVSGDIIRIARSQFYVELIHPPDYDIYRLLREKLGWAGAPRKSVSCS